jgi:hypothetical protein
LLVESRRAGGWTSNLQRGTSADSKMMVHVGLYRVDFREMANVVSFFAGSTRHYLLRIGQKMRNYQRSWSKCGREEVGVRKGEKGSCKSPPYRLGRSLSLSAVGLDI